jgi:integrase/recombinase XerD
LANNLSTSEIDAIIERHMSRKDELPELPRKQAESVESTMYRYGVRKGTIEPTWFDTTVGAVERGVVQVAKALPSIWQQGFASIQENLRRGMFTAERAMEEDWKDVIYMGLIQSNPVFKVMPSRMWPASFRQSYEEYKKLVPTALESEEGFANAIFNEPVEQIRKQSEKLFKQYPWMEAEPTHGFMDIATDPQKLLASVLESGPLMGASGLAAVAGAPHLAFALMYGAEGNEAYEEAIASGASPQEANEAFHIYGAAAAAVEFAQVGHYIKMGKAQYKAVLGSMAKRIKRKTAKEGVKSLTKGWLKAQGMEAIEEATQGTMQEITAKAVYGKPIEPGFVDRRATDMLVAFAMGMPFGATAVTTDVITGGVYERNAMQVARDSLVMEEIAQDVGMKEDDYAVPARLTKAHAKIEDFARRVFGKTVVWYTPDSPASPANDFDGWAHPTDPSIIMLNAKSPKPFHSSTFHEAVHQLEVDNPEAYRELQEIAAEYIQSKPAFKQEVIDKLTRAGYDASDDMVEREILSDVIGRLAADEAFLDRVTGTNPTILQSIGRTIDTARERVRKMLQSEAEKRKEEAMVDIAWVEPYLTDMDALSVKIGDALGRITKPMQEVAMEEERVGITEEEARERAMVPPTIPEPEKKEYTTIPTGWHEVKELADYGKKGLRFTGEGRIAGRKYFDPAWLAQFAELPTRLPPATLKYLRKMTDEIFLVKTRKGENYYLVPKAALAEAMDRLPPQAFERGPAPQRTAGQRINDVINSLMQQDRMSPEEIGRVVEVMARDLGIPIEELPDRAHALVYAGRGVEPPAHRPQATAAHMAYVEATHHPEMTQKKQAELRELVRKLGQRDKLMAIRRPTKAQKAKLAQLPTYEEVMKEIDKYRPKEMEARARAEAEAREAGERIVPREEVPTKAAQEVAMRKAEESRMLAKRKPVIMNLQNAAGKYIYGATLADLAKVAEKLGVDTLTARDMLAEGKIGLTQNKNTIASRRNLMKQFMPYMEQLGAVDVQDITPEMIRSWIQMRSRSGIKGTTINKHLIMLESMFDMLVRDGDMGISPFEAGDISPVKAPPRQARMRVSPEVIQKVIEGIDDSPQGIRDKALILLLFSSGLRASELLGQEIVPTMSAIEKYVRGKGGKERVVMITMQAREALDRYVDEVRPTLKGAETTPALFLNTKGGPMSRESLFYHIKKRFKAAGIKQGTHDLRASFATGMLEAGVSIPALSLLMGHAQYETTGRYIGLSLKFLKQQVEKGIHPKKKPMPSVARVTRVPPTAVQKKLFKGKQPVTNLKTGLTIEKKRGFQDTGGWITPDGSAYLARTLQNNVLYDTHQDDARRVGLSLNRVLKDGVIRLFQFSFSGVNEVGLHYNLTKPPTQAQIDTIAEFARGQFIAGGRNQITIVSSDAKGNKGAHAQVTFDSRATASQAITDAISMVKEQQKPKPSVTRKSRRLYTKRKPSGRLLDTAERMAGRRAQAVEREITEEEMLRVRLRAMETVAKRAFEEGAQKYREKLAELIKTEKTAAGLRKSIRKWVQKELPLAVRGKMLVAIEKTRTIEDWHEAVDALRGVIAMMSKRQAMARLRKFQRQFNKKYANKRKKLYKTGAKFRLDPKTSEIFEKIFERITTKRRKTDEQYADLEAMLEYAQTERQEAERLAKEAGEDISDSPYVRYEIDKAIEQLKTELNKIPVNDWTTQQIDALTDGMTVLLKAHEWERDEYKRKWDLDRNQDVTYSIAEIMSSWKKPKEDRPRDVQNATSHYRVRGFMSFLKGLVGRHNYNLQTLVQIIGGATKGVLYERLVQDIQASVDSMKYEMFYMQDQFQELMKFADITWDDIADWSRLARVRDVKLPAKIEKALERMLPEYLRPKFARREVKELRITLESGQVLEGTVTEFIDILMHLRNDFNYQTLIEQGAVFKDQEYKVMKFTDADFAAIRKAVPKKSLKLIQAMDTLITIQQDRINEVSRRIDGFNLANVDGYWHMRRLLDDPGVRGKEAKYSYETIETRGQWHQRVGGKQPIILGDAFNNMLETLQVGSEYIGMAEAMRNARFLTRNRAIKRQLVQRGYGDYWRDIITQLNRLQEKKNIQAWYESFYSAMARGVTRAVFGFNLRVSAQQYASVFLAASELGFGALKYVRGRPSQELIRRMSAWSPMVRERFLGAIGRELGETAKIGSVMRFLTNQDQMINLPTFFVRFFDKMAITDVWRMAEGVVAEEYGRPLAELLEDAEKDIDERRWPKFEYDVVRRAEETIRATQPTWDVVDRSVIGSDKNPLVRALTMFHSQREKLAQMIGLANSRMMNELNRIRIQYGYKTLREAAKTKEGVRAIGKMATTYGIVLTNTAFVKAWAIIYGITLFDRDDDMYDWAWAVVADIPGMYYFGDIPRDVIVAWGKKMRGKRVYQLGAYESPPVRVVSTARLAAYEMGNLVMMTMGDEFVSDKEMSKQLEKTLDATWEATNYALGLPFMHGTSIFNAWRNKDKKGRKRK